MSLRRHVLTSVAIVTVSLAVLWPVLAPAGEAALVAVGFGAGINLLNTIAAHALVLWSAGRGTREFMGAILGGMLARMAFMLGAVLGGILVLDLPRGPLTGSVLSFFVVFLVVELAVVHKMPGTRLEEVR